MSASVSDRDVSVTAATAMVRLHALASEEAAVVSRRYFKTGEGEYGAGDTFIGVRTPQIRALIREMAAMPLTEVKKLLASKVHEARMLALLVMVRQYERGDLVQRERLFELYRDRMRHVNNWDLVDSSAAQIVGAHLHDGDRSLLDELAASKSLWHRRIAIIATAWFIKRGEYDDTLRIAETLLGDSEDLIHKAVGWMLREVGEKDLAVELRFLDTHSARMPRTMLRCAIEKFPEELRRKYLGSRAGR